MHGETVIIDALPESPPHPLQLRSKSDILWAIHKAVPVRQSCATGVVLEDRLAGGETDDNADMVNSVERVLAEAGVQYKRRDEIDARKDGVISNRERERRIVSALASGALLYPKFKSAEVAASQGEQHERLWHYIISLSVESAEAHPGINGTCSEISGRHDGEDCKRAGGFSGVGARYEESPYLIVGSKVEYLDGGRESRVYDTNSGEVVKVRRASFFDKNGLVDALANIVYHNYLFPSDAYTLEDVARHEKDGGLEFYLILRQPKVEPLTTTDGFIVEPTIGQIMEALNASPMKFSFIDDSHQSAESEFDSDSSESGDGENVDVAKYKAYNGDFLVFDFQPGRNTFIDAKTGKVRFIDPRIMLNNPDENFSAASRFGRRKPYDKPFNFGEAKNAGAFAHGIFDIL